MPTLKNPVSSDDHIQGDVNAPITLVEYGDYQCPYCAMAYPIVKRLQKYFGKQLRFVFRNFPLTEVHPFAEAAAETAEFAADHGKFWQMHDLLYENQDSFEIPFFMELANSLGLPEEELEEVIDDKTYEPKIRKDFLGGVRSGVNGTPTFFINGERHNGSFKYEDLLSAIESVMAK